MTELEQWKNFDLGTELDVSGVFIYNALRTLHEIKNLHYASDIFEILYNLSVGLERLLKITIILLEHDDNSDVAKLEKSIKTHNGMELLKRVQKNCSLPIGEIHNDFMKMLSEFYKSYRYERYSLRDKEDYDREKKSFHEFLNKNLNYEIQDEIHLPITIVDMKMKKSVGKVVGKLANSLYTVLNYKAHELNLYTGEVRSNSKAGKIFLRKEYNFECEDILSKELLIFFMHNARSRDYSGLIEEFESLDFDCASEQKYIQSMNSFEKKLDILDELESLYENANKPRDRLRLMSVLGQCDVLLNFDEVQED